MDVNLNSPNTALVICFKNKIENDKFSDLVKKNTTLLLPDMQDCGLFSIVKLQLFSRLRRIRKSYPYNMFKKDKDLVERSRSLLKNKDIKKIRQDIGHQFPRLQENDLLELFPNKCHVEAVKLASKTVIYMVDNIPYFYDDCGRNNIYPTVFLLWRFPGALVSFNIHSPVSEFILNGADLMLPGLSDTDGLSMLKVGEKVCIMVHGNPLPFAIGTSLIDCTYIPSHGLRGRAMNVTHIYGDYLWHYAPSTIANTGFTLKRIYPIVGSGNLNEATSSSSPSNGAAEKHSHMTLSTYMADMSDFPPLSGSYESSGSVPVKAVVLSSDMSSQKAIKPHVVQGDDIALGKTLSSQQSTIIHSELKPEDNIDEDDEDNNNNDGNNGNGNEDDVDLDAKLGADDSEDVNNEGYNSDDERDENMNDNDDNENDNNNNDDDNDARDYDDDDEDGEANNDIKLEVKGEGIKPLTRGMGSLQVTNVVDTKDVDDALLRALLVELKYVIRDAQLPMLLSTLWSLLLKCASVESAVSSIDIRHSSYKKVSVFLKHAQALGLVKIKEKSGVSSVVDIQRAHDLYKNIRIDNPEQFRATVINGGSGSSSAGPGGAENAATTNGTGTSSTSTNTSKAQKKAMRIQIVDLYKLTKPAKELFGSSVQGQYGDCLKKTEVRDVVMSYTRTLPPPPPPAFPPTLYSSSSSSLTHGVTDRSGDKDSVWIRYQDPLAVYIFGKNWQQKSATAAQKDYDSNNGVDEPTAPMTHRSNELKGDMGYSDRDSDFPALSFSGFSGSTVVGGVMVSDTPRLPSISPRTSTSTSISIPTSSRTSSAAMAGGSAVGGWGVDKGKVWAPVSLSSAAAKTVPQTSSAAFNRNQSRQISSGSDESKVRNKSVSKNTVNATAVVVNPNNDDDGDKDGGGGVWCKKEEVVKALLGKLSACYAVVHGDEVSISTGHPPSVAIEVEQRMGNKVVTRVRGLEALGVDAETVSRHCQKKFACSATVSNVASSAKEKEVVIQGNVATELEDFLIEQYNISKGLINIKILKGVKPKKKS